MRLAHFNTRNWEFNPNLKYKENNLSKPNGLWLSVNNAWRKWCKNEDFKVDFYSVKYQFEVDISNFLILDTREKIIEFDKKYKIDENSLNWQLVKENFDGILFSPYFNYFNDEETWYNNIDVASACVWNLSVIEIL